MAPSSADTTIQQRVLSHTWTLSYCLRLLERLPPDTVLVSGYSDGHTNIAQVTLAQIEAVLSNCIEQLEQDSQQWQHPAFGGAGKADATTDGSAAS